jgi:hypothetical protein
MRRLPRILGPLLGALAAGLTGCGPDIDAICLATEECVGGNDADIEACVAFYDYQAEIADIEGCTDEYDVLFTCAEEVADCQSENTGTPCMDDAECENPLYAYTNCDGTCRYKFYGFEDPDDCEVEQAAYTSCIQQ